MIAETRIVGNKPRWIALWVALLMLFAAWGSAFAECQEGNFSKGNVLAFYNNPYGNCNSEQVCVMDCPERLEEDENTYYLDRELVNQGGACSYFGSQQVEGCGTANARKQFTCMYHLRCSKCDLDSIACVQGGDTWTPSQVAGECGQCSKCDQKDTTWREISCAYFPSKGMYGNIVNEYTIKNCEPSSRSWEYFSPQCDSAGADTAWRCIGSIDGVHVQLQSQKFGTRICDADGSCAAAQIMNIEGKCRGGQSSSSQDGGGSSSSAESSSSEGSSSSGDGSSSSGGGSSDSGDGSNDWEQWMKDSLGAIHWDISNIAGWTSGIYDGVWEMSGTAHDMNTNLISINESTAGIDDKMSSANEYLRTIANKDFSPTINVGSPDVNVNVDTDGIQSRQDKTRDTLHHTNEILDGLGGKLEDIKGLLGSSGSDTIRIDTSKAPASIDSALKHWGNRNNHTFAAAGLDSSGWGHTNDSAGAAADSVISSSNFFGSLGCDTTGGKKCDGSIIGADGLATATGSMKATYGELRDSLTGGAYADSLRLWGGKFTGNGVLTGSGSNSCPSILTKTYRVDIYKGAGYDFTLGTYLCAPLFGQTTAWSLCRMLLRATIALACMWFLFKCATGFGGGSED